MKRSYLLILICCSLTVTAQNWQSYNNRIPAWPQDINTTSAEAFLNSLTSLKQEIQDKLPNLTSRYENISQAEAMKLAQQYKKNVMNLSPQEMARRAQLNEQAMNVELPEEME